MAESRIHQESSELIPDPLAIGDVL